MLACAGTEERGGTRGTEQCAVVGFSLKNGVCKLIQKAFASLEYFDFLFIHISHKDTDVRYMISVTYTLYRH